MVAFEALTRALARARRIVGAFGATSTIRAWPRSSRCVREGSSESFIVEAAMLPEFRARVRGISCAVELPSARTQGGCG